MSTLKVNNLQVGQDATATNNFTLYQPAVPDGTVRLGVGNSGSVADLLTVNGTAAKLQINTSTGTTGLKIVGLDTNGYSDLDINSVGTIGYSRLFFSDTAGQSGSIIYAHGTNSLQFKTGGSVSATLGGDGLIVGDFTPIDTRNAGGVQVAHSKGISFRSNTSQSVSRNWRIRNDDWGWGNLDFGVGNSVSDVSDSASDTVLSLTSSRNVGIGTTNPSCDLDVWGAVTTSGSAQGGSTTANIRVVDTSPINAETGGTISFSYLWSDPPAELGNPPYIRAVKTNAATGNYGGGLAFGTRVNNGSQVERVRITELGNVGIGTTNPSTSLEIKKDVGSQIVNLLKLTNSSTAGNPGQSIVFQGYYNSAVISAFQTPTFSLGGNLQLQTYNGSNTLNTGILLNKDGNVGIGTANPNGKLDVRGDTVFYGRRTSYSSSTGVVSREYSGNYATATAHRPAVFRYVRFIDVTSSGNQLRIPIPYQGNYNTHTMMHIRGSSARYNNRDHRFFDVKIAIGHLTVLSNMSVYDQNGNISSITTTTGTDANNPHYININFTIAYTSGILDGLYLWLEYFTAVENSSILVDGIYLN